jgi:DNA repair protein RecO
LTSEFGLVTIIATGAIKEKSSFTGLLEPFNQLHLELYRTPRSEIYNLKSAGLIKIHSEKVSYKTLILMNAAVELFLQVEFTVGDDAKFYQLLQNYLIYLKESSYNQFLLFVRLVLRLLQYIGIPLELACQKCGAGKVTYFSPHEDGFLCDECHNPLQTEYLLVVESSSVATLQKAYRLKDDTSDAISREVVTDFRRILLTHLENHFNKKFRLNSLEDY